MKQILHSLALCGSLLALASCAATDIIDESDNEPEVGNVTLVATLALGASTRTDFAEATDGTGGVKVTWASGDAISIQGSNDTNPITFTCTELAEDGTSGIFSSETNPEEGSEVTYRIIYPAAATYNGTSVARDMTTQAQTGNASMTHLGAYDVMHVTAATDWKSVTFTANDRKTALMTFDLAGIPADLGTPQSITLGSTSDSPVFYPNVDTSTSKVSTLQLRLNFFNPPSGSDAISIKAHLMMVGSTAIPAGKSLTITVKGDKGSYTFISPEMPAGGKTYEAGKRYTATVGADGWAIVRASTTYDGTATAVAFTTGDGSAAKPYEIASAEQLCTLIKGVATNN